MVTGWTVYGIQIIVDVFHNVAPDFSSSFKAAISFLHFLYIIIFYSDTLRSQKFDSSLESVYFIVSNTIGIV